MYLKVCTATITTYHFSRVNGNFLTGYGFCRNNIAGAWHRNGHMMFVVARNRTRGRGGWGPVFVARGRQFSYHEPENRSERHEGCDRENQPLHGFQPWPWDDLVLGLSVFHVLNCFFNLGSGFFHHDSLFRQAAGFCPYFFLKNMKDFKKKQGSQGLTE